MKKIVILFDGQNFSRAAFDFAARLNEQNPVLLAGVFLPSVDYTKMVYYLGGIDGAMLNAEMEIEADEKAMEANIAVFKELCVANNIEHRVHATIKGTILEGITHETRYADLVILSSDLFYRNLGDRGRNRQLEKTIHLAECPVVVLPEQYTFPESIILAFNGSESSMFAIKQFAYLFPELSGLRTMVVYATRKTADMPDFDYIKEYAARHYPDLTFFKLAVDPDEYFNTWITDVKASMLVAGAFGRSVLSESFFHSFTEDIISTHKLPVFIAHK